MANSSRLELRRLQFGSVRTADTGFPQDAEGREAAHRSSPNVFLTATHAWKLASRIDRP